MAQVPNAGTTYTSTPKKFPYDIYVTPECLAKMNEYGRAAQPCEVGGLARIEINKETKNIFVIDIEVFPQRAYPAFWEMSAEARNDWTRKMIKEGRADELAEWKSIFHTHPIGMGPSMSGHDIDQIMEYAEEEDAFSFILSSSNNADSTRMFMHYCCNFYGEKYVIKDIPVKTSISADRVALSDQMTKYLAKKLGGKDALNEKDMERLDELVTEFLTAKVPMYFEEGRNALRESIEHHVAAVVDKHGRSSKDTKGYTPSVGDYAAGSRQQQAHAIENDAIHAMMEDAVNRGEMTQREADAYFANLTDDEQEELGYYTPQPPLPNAGDYEDQIKELDHLYTLAFENFDSRNPNRKVSKSRAKKAARMWELRAKKLNEKLRKETEEEIGLYDLVLVDYSKIASNKNNSQGTNLDTEPHTVDSVIHDKTGWSFEVGGELFWAHELKVHQKFEDALQEARTKAMERAIEKAEQERSKKLADASKMMDEALVNGPGDTTGQSTALTTTK